LFVSVLLLGVSWAAAQDPSSSTNPTSANPSQSASANSGDQMSIQGCLSASNGSYALTDKDGVRYQLSGDTAKLSKHVGHEVIITGTSSSASPASGGTATGATGDSQQTLQVTSVKHIASTCQSGGMSK
jgi:Protein of unknown function (DUF5818)